MKTKLLISVLVLVITVLSCRKAGVELKANKTPDPNPGGSTHEPAFFGTNLSGAEFGANVPGEHQQDYSYPLPSDLDYFKSKGFRLVRLPFKWERVQKEMFGPLDPLEVKRITDFLTAAEEREMLVTPDVHNFARRVVNGQQYVIGSQEVPTAAFVDFWGKLATVFKDRPNIWALGIMNEPYAMPSNNAWFNIAQATIDKIRTVDSKTPLLIGGDSYSSSVRWVQESDNLKNLTDPSDKLIYEAHIYFDADASGTYKGTYDTEKATPQTGVERLKPFVDWLKANNKKGFIGEYGVPDDDARWLIVLNNMLQYMKDNCINGTYWSAGPRWGTYKLAIQPRQGADRPQMSVLKNFLVTDPSVCK